MLSTVIKKVISKITDLTVGKIIYKKKYYPKGIIKDIEAYTGSLAGAGDECKVIYPAFLPEYKFHSFNEFVISDIVKSEGVSGTIPVSRSIAVKIINGRLDTDCYFSVAVFNRHDKLLEEVCFQHGYVRENHADLISVERNNIFNRPYIKKPKKIAGIVCSLLTGGGGVNNFGHWLVDAMPRIHLVKKAGWFEQVDKFLVPNYAYGFQREILEMLGIDQDRVLNGMEYTHIIADELIVTSHPRPFMYYTSSWVSRFLQRSFADYMASQENDIASLGPYVYMSRRDAKWRKVLNEEEVIRVLKERGFSCVDIGKYSVREKMLLLRDVKVLASVPSAGLTNMLFCPAETHILEMFPDFLVEPFYVELANSLNFPYSFFISDLDKIPANVDNNETDKFNMTVDISKLIETLDKLPVLV